MVQVDCSAELDMPADLMFVERDLPAFQALLAQALNLSVMEVRDTWELEGDEGEVVELITKPDVEQYVPKSMRRYINMDMVFVDEITYRKSKTQGPTYELEIVSKIGFLKDNQYSISNMLLIEPLGPDRCRQSLKGDVKINVFGIGSVVQGIVVNSLNTAYKLLPEVVQKWKKLRKQPGVLSPDCRPCLDRLSSDVTSELRKPFSEVSLNVPAAEAAALAPKGDALKGMLQTTSAIYFDAVEVLEVVDEDEVTREAAVNDRVALLDELQKSGAEQAPPKLVLHHQDTGERRQGTRDRIKARHARFSAEWNERKAEWQAAFAESGLPQARFPNVGRRLGHLLSGMNKLGLLAADSSTSFSSVFGSRKGEADEGGSVQDPEASAGSQRSSLRSLGSQVGTTSTNVAKDVVGTVTGAVTQVGGAVVAAPMKLGEGVVLLAKGVAQGLNISGKRSSPAKEGQ